MWTAIITIILTAIIGGIGWLQRNETEKRRDIERQLSDKKYAVYLSIIDLFFEVVNGSINKTQAIRSLPSFYDAGTMLA